MVYGHSSLMYGSLIKVRFVSYLTSVLGFSNAFRQESAGFAGLCSLREIHSSPEDLECFEILFSVTVNYYKCCGMSPM